MAYAAPHGRPSAPVFPARGRRKQAMLRRLTPFAYKARGLIQTIPGLDAAGARETVIAPAEDDVCPPAVMLDGQLDRITGLSGELQWDEVRLKMLGGPVRHAATIAYTFDRALVLAGAVYAGGGIHRLREFDATALRRPIAKLDDVAFCSSDTGDRYFGHALAEDLAQALLAPEFGAPARLIHPGWGDFDVYSRLSGVDWRYIAAADVRNLTVFRDYSYTASRRGRLKELRRRLRASVPPSKRHRRIFIDRTGGTARTLTNKEEVFTALERHGFGIVTPGQMGTRDMLEGILDAEIVAGVEGSHMAHATFAVSDNGAGLILAPPGRFVVNIKDRFDAIGVPLGFVVGDAAAAPGNPDSHEGESFSVPVDMLLRTIDLLDARR